MIGNGNCDNNSQEDNNNDYRTKEIGRQTSERQNTDRRQK